MARRRPAPARPLVEAALWIAVVAAAGFVLLPALAEYFQARRLEEQERARLAGAEKDLGEASRLLWWMAQDPLGGRKLLDTPPGAARRKEAPAALAPALSPGAWESREIPLAALPVPP